MVTLVGAPGSRALAHNLDDLRERWELKNAELEKVFGKTIVITPKIELDENATYQEVQEQYRKAALHAHEVAQQISALKLRKHEMPKHQYELIRQTLGAESEYRLAICKCLKSLAQQKHDEYEAANPNIAVDRLKELLAQERTRRKMLENLLDQHNIEIPAE